MCHAVHHYLVSLKYSVIVSSVQMIGRYEVSQRSLFLEMGYGASGLSSDICVCYIDRSLLGLYM